MTVKELMEMLKELPEDAKIFIENSEIYGPGVYEAGHIELYGAHIGEIYQTKGVCVSGNYYRRVKLLPGAGMDWIGRR